MIPMEKWAYVLIALSLFLLVIIIGLLSVLIYKLFKNQSPPATLQPSTEGESIPTKPTKEFHPAIIERMNELRQIKPQRPDLFCPNHRDEPGETVCAICDKLFCASCIKDFKTLHFCKEHLPLIMNYEWDEVYTLKTSSHDPERGVRLYDLKKEIFERENLPAYIETHYKINVDQDHIETYLVIFAKRENVQFLRSFIENELDC